VSLDDSDGSKIEKKVVLSIRGCLVEHMYKNGANFIVKPLKNKYGITILIFLNCRMVQNGILMMVVVMKRNGKIVVPSIRGSLRAFCCGECHEVHVLLYSVPPCTRSVDINNAYSLNLK